MMLIEKEIRFKIYIKWIKMGNVYVDDSVDHVIKVLRNVLILYHVFKAENKI